MCYIQFAGYTCVYVVPGVCNSYYVQSNYVLLVVANDDTTSAVLPTKRGAHENAWNTEPPGKRVCLPRSEDALARLPKRNNRPRCPRVVNSGIHAPHPLDLREVITSFPNHLSSLTSSVSSTSDLASSVLSLLLSKTLWISVRPYPWG